MTTTTTLAARLVAASIAVGALATDKRNAQQGYDYISADKVLERAGDALAHAGVVLIPSITAADVLAVETRTSRGEGMRYDAEVTFAMTLTDGATTLEFPWRGRGSDYAVPDKAMYKAITSGHKYFLTKLLNIGVGNEDGEHEAVEAPQPAQARNTTRAPAPPRSAPAVQPVGEADGDVIFDRGTTWYADARNNLPAAHRKVADDMTTLHRNNGGPASAKAYGYLCGLIDSIVEQAMGAKDAHKRVLAVLCQMDVTQDNRPSATMTGRLLARLATHIKDQVSQQKIVNPDYDEDTADAMIAIYRAAEAVGTPSLLEVA